MYGADIQNRSDDLKGTYVFQLPVKEACGDKHTTDTCPTDVTSFSELKCVDLYPGWENYISQPRNSLWTKDPWAD